MSTINIDMPEEFSYIRDPKEIERQSFLHIKNLPGLHGLDELQKQVAMRLIHTHGDELIVETLRFSDRACESGINALEKNRPIITDVEMVRSGISPICTSPNYCFIRDSDVIEQARSNNITRSMVAMERAKDLLPGCIVLIGNAPTALFRLLELLSQGTEPPSLIIAMPVGFVGAQESKQACWEFCRSHAIPVITLLGQRGGSALCVAALNALCRLAKGIRL